MRVLRIYHGGRDPSHRARERALAEIGLDVTLAVPRLWPDAGSERALSDEPFPIVQFDVHRAGDVNRHRYTDTAGLRRLILDVRPNVLDIHEEPFSAAARQVLSAAPSEVPVVMYTAQNVDKRFPPPFSSYERLAHRRAAALYPCSRQAASVARGKGFDGLIEVIPIGFDPHLFTPGWQSLEDEVVTLALLGRLVPEKGVLDAVRLLAAVTAERAARLVLVGSGPDELRARRLASELGVGERLEIVSWASSVDVAAILRTAHIVLVPSVATDTWTEQFGRVIVEAQASGAVVVGYATGSIHEVGGEPAALVRPADVRALAELARRLLRDPVEYERRRRGGIARSKGRTWIDVATRQGRLYEQAVAGVKRLELPRSPARRREVAREEFGPTAPTRTGYRPFALPVLRSAGPIARAGGRLTDAAAEVVALGHLGARIRE